MGADLSMGVIAFTPLFWYFFSLLPLLLHLLNHFYLDPQIFCFYFYSSPIPLGVEESEDAAVLCSANPHEEGKGADICIDKRLKNRTVSKCKKSWESTILRLEKGMLLSQGTIYGCSICSFIFTPF